MSENAASPFRPLRRPLRAARLATIPAALLAVAFAAGCSPTVKVEAPDKPIEINLNVRIEQEVRIRVERDVEKLLKTEDGLF